MANRIDELANELQRSGRIGELESELRRFDLRKLDDAEREAWHHLWGIAAFRRGDRVTAMDRFVAALEACPTSGQIRFALGQECEYIGNVERMLELFDACRFPAVPAQYALTQAQFAYLWNRLDKAIDYVLPIVNACWDLGIADDNFLYIRGLPFFGDTWSTLGAFYELQGDLGTFRHLTVESARRLSEYDFDRLLRTLDGIGTGDFSRVLSDLNDVAIEIRGFGGPTGYHAMLAAVVEAELNQDHVAADRQLSAVRIGASDFPWLNDIRLLAQCSLAHRMGDAWRERQLQEQFLRKQPLLFEPHHVFSFRLVRYQETLKKRYRESKRST